MKDFKVYIRTPEYSVGYDFIVIATEYNGKRFKAKRIEIEWEELKEGEMVEPMLHLPDLHNGIGLFEALKKAINSIPDEGQESQIKAIKYHLEDMRRLVFKTEVAEVKKGD